MNVRNAAVVLIAAGVAGTLGALTVYSAEHQLLGAMRVFLQSAGIVVAAAAPLLILISIRDYYRIRRPPLLQSLLDSPLGIGAGYGVLLGFKISAAYSALLSLPLVIVPLGLAFTTPIAVILGILPASILGLLAGGTIGWILGNRAYPSGKAKAAWIGAGVACAFSVVVNLALLDMWKHSVIGSIYVGIPSGIFIVAGGWAGHQIAKRLNSKHGGKEK